VKTGNAQIGFVALSQAVSFGGEWIDIPTDIYDPVVQGAGLLLHSDGNSAAMVFFDYLSSDAVQKILVSSGYGVPA